MPATGPTTPGMRRPVRTMTLPSTSSRRIRFGEPTSSEPSGVMVAALMPNPAAFMARAASETQAFDVERRCSSDRSWRSRTSSTDSSAGSSTRRAASSSSCPVSSPSRTMIFRGSAIARSLARSGLQLLALEPELLGLGLERGDHERHVLVEVDPELLGAAADVVAIDGRRERRLLELLLDRLGRQPADALR